MQYFSIPSTTEPSVVTLQSLAEEGFGKENLVLVQSNGLKFEDSLATKGWLIYIQ